MTVTAQGGPKLSLVVSTLAKVATPKITGLYPCNPKPLVFLSDKAINTIAHLINWLS
jgi:hypothetical protein